MNAVSLVIVIAVTVLITLMVWASNRIGGENVLAIAFLVAVVVGIWWAETKHMRS